MAARSIKRNQKPPRPLVLPCDNALAPESCVKRRKSLCGALPQDPAQLGAPSKAASRQQPAHAPEPRLTRSRSAALQRQQSAPEGLTDAMLLRCGRAGAASITDDESVQRWGQVCAFSDTEVECVAGLSPQQDSQGLSQVDSQLSCGSTLLLLPHAHSMPAVRSLSSPGGPAATPGRSSQVPLLHTLSLDAMARRGGSSSGGGAPGGVASLAARRGRPGSATLCVDTAMCTFFDAAAPATSSGSGGAAAPPSCEPCAANGRSSCLAGCGGQCGAGCSGPPHSSGAPPARNAARAGCTRGGAGSAAAAVGERGSDCTTTGWFGRCRGCAQLTGGELLLHMGGVPFCGPCAGRLAGVPADQRACCEQQLLHIHQSWALSGH